MRILIADDHAVVRTGLKQILNDINDIGTIDEACNGKEALMKVQSDFYDVVVLDISMPGMNGLDILKQLKTEQPHLQVLMLSIHPEEQYALRVLKAGASGYLTKASAPEELVRAIKKISAGGKYINESLADRLADNMGNKTKAPSHESLSDREFQIMLMIAQGKTIKDIAAELFISDKTVSTYRSRLLNKMGMKNNAELIHYVNMNRLIE